MLCIVISQAGSARVDDIPPRIERAKGFRLDAVGQPDLFPEPIRGVALRSAPVILVIGLTIFWLVRVLSTGWYRKQAAVQDEPGVR